MTKRRLKEVHCPVCGKIFIARKPRSLKQWRVSLAIHLTAGIRHHLPLNEAIKIVDDYIKKLESRS